MPTRVVDGSSIATVDVPVQVCDICVVSIDSAGSSLENSPDYYLRVVRRTGSATFQNVFSADQPDLRPSPGESGV